ncbi:hypothetical protein HPB48_008855 [Haemaphysalis longicornis]|uniref:Kelch-like protein diablo n=1 Tax=Haemaphysalis longicornis TaxID=44386 RepID=A0A9J6H0C1_HAELO|nr:hypothetical protein HPB48_008855 [Haemaphysalis longicornis]
MGEESNSGSSLASEEASPDEEMSSSKSAVEPLKDPGNMERIFSSMDALRKDKVLCDVLLCAEGEEFPCHKVVLASCSPYFKAMFTTAMAEKEQHRVPVNNVGASELRTLLDFVYTSTIGITDTNVETLLSAANYLQVTGLKDACCRFIEARLDETNCLGVYQLADSPETRKEGFEEIFKHVRLPLMNPYYLAHKVAETPEVIQNETCCKLLEEAKMFHLLPDRRRESSRPWTTPRSKSSMLEAAVLVGGHDQLEPVRNVDCYIPSKGKWLDLAPLRMGVYKHGVTASGQNSLFVVGGEHRRVQCKCNDPTWIFHPALNSYCQAAAMTCRRRNVSLASVDGCVYAVGATDNEPDVPSVERYNAGVTDTADDERVGCIQCFDPDSDRWETVSSSLPPLSYSSPCVLNGKLYLVGGWDSWKRESSRSVVCFDPKTSTWNICEPMKEGRASPGVAVMESKIFVFGGSPDVGDERQAVGTMETYHPETNKWLWRGKMKVKRSWFGCTTLNIPYSMAHRRRASK